MPDERRTHLVAARLDTEFGGKGNGGAKPQEGVEGVDDDEDEGVEGETLLDGGGEQIEQTEDGNDSASSRVVDNGGVAGKGLLEGS